MQAMASKKEQTDATWPDVVRIPAETKARLQRCGAAMGKRALTELPPAVVVRAALDRGLDLLEDELGIARKK
jgi:hypothetical protein